MTRSTGGNVAALLAAAAASKGERDAIVTVAGGDPRSGIAYRRVTYEELEGRVRRVAAALRRRGCAPGQGVLLFVPMSTELYVLMLAFLRVGAVVAFLDPWASPAHMRHVRRLMDLRWFVAVPGAFAFLLRHGELRSIPHRISTRSFPLGPRWTLPLLEGEGDGDESICPREDDDPAIVTFTSGSTGRPKGANRSHGFLRAQHRVINRAFGYRAEDVDLPAFPIFVLNGLATGLTCVVPRMDFRRPAEVDPAWIFAQMTDLGVTTAGGSPAYCAALCRWALERDHRVTTVRRVFTGGAPVAPALLERLARVFPEAEVQLVYGSTETQPVTVADGDEIVARSAKPGAAGRGSCVGRPIEDMTVRLLRPLDRPVAGDELDGGGLDVTGEEVGEIVVAGEAVCRSYHGDEEATRRHKIVDGQGRCWHRSGDLARRDGEGRLWIVGRIGSTIEREGRIHHPVPMEAVARAVPGVAAAACVGLPDGKRGEGIHLAVTLEGGARATDVEEALRRRWRDLDWPLDAFHLVEALPTDPRHNAKIDRPALRRLLEGRRREETPWGAMRAYLAERFPLGKIALPVAFFVAAHGMIAWRVTGRDVGGVPLLALWLLLLLQFFRLRVMDEWKDRDEDRRAHPARVLSRGTLSYGALVRVAVFAVLVEAALAGALGGLTAIVWACALLWSLAMGHEFGVGPWLRRRPWTYAWTHCLVMAFHAWEVYVTVGGERASFRAPLLWGGAFVAVGMGLLVHGAKELKKVEGGAWDGGGTAAVGRSLLASVAALSVLVQLSLAPSPWRVLPTVLVALILLRLGTTGRPWAKALAVGAFLLDPCMIWALAPF